jgi:L-asparaginase
MSLKKNILILHTGGTFGMAWDESRDQTSNEALYLGDLTARVPEVLHIANVTVEVLFNLDSSSVSLEHWEQIAKSLERRFNEFDGFVVIHGTDTMAYTASALAFFLGNLTKTVVLTGSQRPLSQWRNDARANLIDAVELASTGLPEVLLCFDGLVHRGVRATKESNEHLHAFSSPNSSPVAQFGVHFRVRKSMTRKPYPDFLRTPPQLDCRACLNILSLTALPGTVFSNAVIDALLAQYKGFVLIAFGSGNLPTHDGGFGNFIRAAFAREVPVVLSSQCRSGMVRLETYSSGRTLMEWGVVPARDMTLEAASLKLMVQLGRGVPFSKRLEFFETPLAGECSRPQEDVR